jgi:hypothetical protein
MTLKDKLTYNRIRWYGQILKMNEEGMPKKILNIKKKENIQEEN